MPYLFLVCEERATGIMNNKAMLNQGSLYDAGTCHWPGCGQPCDSVGEFLQ